MATLPVNVQISTTGPVTYTVPASKLFTGQVCIVSAGTSAVVTVLVNGVGVGTISGPTTGAGGFFSPSLKPMRAGAGDVISITSSSGNATAGVVGQTEPA